MPKKKFPEVVLRPELTAAQIKAAHTAVYELLDHLPDGPLADGIGRKGADRVNTLLGELLGLLEA